MSFFSFDSQIMGKIHSLSIGFFIYALTRYCIDYLQKNSKYFSHF